MGAPDIATSTNAERLAYIYDKFRCFVEVSMTLRDS